MRDKLTESEREHRTLIIEQLRTRTNLENSREKFKNKNQVKKRVDDEKSETHSEITSQ